MKSCLMPSWKLKVIKLVEVVCDTHSAKELKKVCGYRNATKAKAITNYYGLNKKNGR